MNSSSHHYLSCWPRNTTTAHLSATTLTYCTNGPLRRWSSVTMAIQAPARIFLVIPQDTLPTCIRVKKESITIEGCKSSIFVDDARNVCKETFSCSVLIWALDRFLEHHWVCRLRILKLELVLEMDQTSSLSGRHFVIDPQSFWIN